MWCFGSVFAPFRFHLFENNRDKTEQTFVEDIEDGVSFNIDGNVADTVLSHEDHGTWCSSAKRENITLKSNFNYVTFFLCQLCH